MRRAGIMQGRLSPAPLGRAQQFPAQWQDEFTRARACGFDEIEWLVTAESLDTNPILSSDGVDAIHNAMARTGVRVASVCADCFIAQPLIDPDQRSERLALLIRLIAATRDAGGAVLVMPFLESNALGTRTTARAMLSSMKPALDIAADAGIVLAIECDLASDALRTLVDDVGHSALGICYDTGNAAAAGLDPASEILHLEHYVSEVHLKDRRRGGSSVALGSGDVHFDAVGAALDRIGFTGPLILETPAGDDPAASAIANREFFDAHALKRQAIR